MINFSRISLRFSPVTIRHMQLLCLGAVLISVYTVPALAQAATPQHQDAITIEGSVRDSTGQPIADAFVVLEDERGSKRADLKTKTDGFFVFSTDLAGTYTLRAEKLGVGNTAANVVLLSRTKSRHVDLVIEPSTDTAFASTDKVSPSRSSPTTIEFEDRVNFTVAGVTDWSNVGLHGADTSVRTSETLAQETVALKSSSTPEHSPGTPDGAGVLGDTRQSESSLRAALKKTPDSFEANHQLGEYYLAAKTPRDAIPLLESAYRIDPVNQGNAYDLALAYEATGDFTAAREQIRKLLANGADSAKLHHLLGEADERSGDSLQAVHEFELSARLDPSEQNYFDWGAELLLHKAAVPAVEIFTKGSAAHPRSARMLAGLGAAYYASGSYEEAALRLCNASDLNPSDSAPYIFLGQVEKATVAPSPCSVEKLGRFAHEQPENSLGNYYYALVLWKRARESANAADSKPAEELLQKAVKINPQFGDAYLQLGVLYSARNDFSQAIPCYQKAIEINPRLAEARFRLSVAYKQIGQESKAKQEFQIYKQVEKTEAAEIEQKRKELQQFLVILGAQPATIPPR
jgi:tetratricopeptide (TPR) repeat protein